MRGLVGDELRFARQRNASEVVPAAEIVDRGETRRAPFARDEPVGREQLRRHRANTAPLMLA
jgi:hypothetical protein